MITGMMKLEGVHSDFPQHSRRVHPVNICYVSYKRLKNRSSKASQIDKYYMFKEMEMLIIAT